jgi:hypothetical protein
MRATTLVILLLLLVTPVGFAQQQMMGGEHQNQMDSTMGHQGMMSPQMNSPQEMAKYMDKHVSKMQEKLDQIEAELAKMEGMTDKAELMQAINREKELTKELHIMMANHREMSDRMMSMVGVSQDDESGMQKK